jgi:hypothetical protein
MAILSAPSHFRAIARALAAGTLASLLTACDGNSQSTATATAGSDTAGSPQQLEASVGEVTVYMSAIQTSSIPAEVAREHGIAQRDDLIMLRVSPRRRGSNEQILSAPVEVQATATKLGAAPLPLSLQQVVTNGLVDHVGTLEVQLPETVSFQVTVATPGGASETLSLTGNFN